MRYPFLKSNHIPALPSRVMRLCYWRARKIARDPESHGKWIMIPVRLYRGGVITLVYERRGRQGQQAVLVGSR